MAKKTNTGKTTTKKSSSKPKKKVEELSSDEIVELIKNNETELIETVKDEENKIVETTTETIVGKEEIAEIPEIEVIKEVDDEIDDSAETGDQLGLNVTYHIKPIQGLERIDFTSVLTPEGKVEETTIKETENSVKETVVEQEEISTKEIEPEPKHDEENTKTNRVTSKKVYGYDHFGMIYGY